MDEGTHLRRNPGFGSFDSALAGVLVGVSGAAVTFFFFSGAFVEGLTSRDRREGVAFGGVEHGVGSAAWTFGGVIFEAGRAVLRFAGVTGSFLARRVGLASLPMRVAGFTTPSLLLGMLTTCSLISDLAGSVPLSLSMAVCSPSSSGFSNIAGPADLAGSSSGHLSLKTERAA